MNGGSSIEVAADWVIALMSGSLALTLAVLGIAAIGFAMLAGRIDIRRVGLVILGCFLVFGANAIAARLLGVATNRNEPIASNAELFQPEAPIVQPKRAEPPPGYDPYAGAALPERR